MKNKILVACSTDATNIIIQNVLLNDAINIKMLKATCGWEALNLIAAQQLEVAFLDCSLKKIDALTITKLVKQLGYCTKIIIVNSNKNLRTMRKAMEYGALGYLSILQKQEIEDCLSSVLNGEFFVDTELYYDHYFSKNV